MNTLIKSTILVTSIAFASTANAACTEKFTGEGTGWYWASNVALLADYSTTLGVAQQRRADGSPRFREVAPITRKLIGSQPSTSRIQHFFAGRILLNAAIQCFAPRGSLFKRLTFQAQTLANGYAALSNARLGLKFNDAAQIMVGAGGFAGISYSFNF